MTQIAVPGGQIVFPGPLSQNTLGTFITGVQALSAGTHRAAFIVRVPKTGTLDLFAFYSAIYSGTNSPRVSFQDVDLTTGNPDAGVDQFRAVTVTSVAWTTPGLITSDGTDTGTKRSVTRGDYLACVMDFSAYTSGSWQIQNYSSRPTAARDHYTTTFGGATWVKTSNSPCFVLKYDDGTYAFFDSDDIYPMKTITTVSTFNTGSTPDEIACRFMVPWDVTVTGAMIDVDVDGDVSAVLYSGTTVLATGTMDKDVRTGTAGDWVNFVFDTEVSLSRNTEYRLALKPTTATNITMYYANIDTNALLAGAPGGVEWYYSERTDAGAWSDTNTRRPLGFSLRISKIDDGTGSTGFAGMPRNRVFAGM